MKSSHKPGNDWENVEQMQAAARARMEAAQEMAARLRDAVAGAR